MIADFWTHLVRQFKVDEPTLIRVAQYLAHYGRLGGTVIDWVVNLGKAIVELKAAAGLAPTETIDSDLLTLLGRPRCGCLDVQRMGIELARWRKTNLTYFVAAYVNGLPRNDQDAILATAWRYWADVANIKVSLASTQQQADIVIATGRGSNQGFDGPSGTLAWAYLPSGNDQQLLMRFDIDEKWVASGGGVLMLNVACHEFGHLLGLDHSKQGGALMAPFYSPGISKPQAVDDIPRIQALYGVAGPSQPVPPLARKTITIEVVGDYTIKQ